MSTSLNVVVVAVPALVDALRRTGQFAQVVAVASTGGLRDLLASGTLSRAANDKVFIFADTTPVDTEQTLPFLISRLAAMGTPVIVVATSPAGRDLVQRCPGAGLLEGPLKLNQVLGAISGHNGLPVLTPVAENPEIALPGIHTAPAAVPAPGFGAPSPFEQPAVQPQQESAPAFAPAPASASPFGGPSAAPIAQPPVAETVRPTAPGAGGSFADFAGAPVPVAVPEQGAPASGQPLPPAQSPFGQPAPTGSSPFGQPATTPVASSPFGGPAPEQAASASPFAQQPSHVEQSPFGQAPQAAPAAPAASPFGQLAPAEQSPFGQPAQAVPAASPFGQPAAPVAASPFGQQTAEPAPSPFGQATPAQGAASPFGSPAGAPVEQSPFGQAVPTPQAGGQSPFGAGATPLEQSPFGAGTASFGPATTNPVSGFSGAAPSGFEGGAQPGSPFGMPAARAGAEVAARPQRRGHVITVTAPKGGTGKSTMTLNLAAYLGLRLRGTGRNVCLIDANVQQADAGKYLNAWTPNIEGLLKDPSAIHPDRITDHLLHKTQLNLSVLLGPASPEVANPMYFSGKRYSQILDALKPLYDYILIDTPVAELYHDIFRDFAIPRADFIAVVATPNVPTLINTDSWLRQVTAPVNADGMGFDPANIGIVLNRAEDDIGIDEDEVRRELAEWRFLAAVPETKEWKRCNNGNELVATRNYHELNEAFSIVLAAATGEDLVTTGSALAQTKATRPSALRRIFGGKK